MRFINYVLILALGLCAGCMSTESAAEKGDDIVHTRTFAVVEPTKGVNLIQLEFAGSEGVGFEFKVRSEKPFPVGGYDPVLIIGDDVLREYKYLEKGDVLSFSSTTKPQDLEGVVFFGWASGPTIESKVSVQQVWTPAAMGFEEVKQ